jgi:hypothetical protein
MHLAFRLLVVGALLTVLGCSSDKGNENNNNEPDGGGGSGGSGEEGPPVRILDDGGRYCPPATPIVDNDKCVTKDAAEKTCKDRAVEQVPGTSVDDPSCGAGCTCTKCTQTMLDCGNDPEGYCGKIIECANAKNCTGTNCYQPATCMDVIDAAPNGGVGSNSVALASAVGACVQPAMGAQVCMPACN